MPDITLAEAERFAEEAALADAHLDQLLYETPEEVDAIGVAFSLWCSLTQVLAQAGWTGEELARDVHHHAAMATCEGGIQ